MAHAKILGIRPLFQMLCLHLNHCAVFAHLEMKFDVVNGPHDSDKSGVVAMTLHSSFSRFFFS